MREFSSFGAFAAHFQRVLDEEHAAIHAGLEAGIAIAHAEARREIGTYQSAVGPFGAWPGLAEATQTDRTRKGFSDDEPLLRDGTLRDAIESHVEGDEAAIGVPSREVSSVGRSVDIGLVAEVQEMGNDRVPARSFLGGALCREADAVVDAVVEPVIRLLEGEP